MAYFTLPAQSAWPQRHTISILFPIPSQCGLQYFALLGGIQLQAAFAHFLGLAIVLLCLSRRRHSEPGISKYDAKIAAIVAPFGARAKVKIDQKIRSQPGFSTVMGNPCAVLLI